MRALLDQACLGIANAVRSRGLNRAILGLCEQRQRFPILEGAASSPSTLAQTNQPLEPKLTISIAVGWQLGHTRREWQARVLLQPQSGAKIGNALIRLIRSMRRDVVFEHDRRA